MPADPTKDEYPPLLDIGRHPFTLDTLRMTCVDAFPKSQTRAGIMDNLSQVIARLETDGVVGDLWIGGSFLTKKIDPEDADVVLRMDAAAYESAPRQTRAAVDWLNSNLFVTHKIDSYVFFAWPQDHPLYWHGEYAYAYWMKQWGFSRRDVQKGIAEIKLKGSVP